MGDATSLLVKWNSGDAKAREALLNRLYDQLTAIAGHHLSGERDLTELQPASLVHEAYMRLIDMNRIDWQDRAHFLSLAGRVMRQILIDHARRRRAAKRDGGMRMTLSGLGDTDQDQATDVLMLHAALDKLAEVDPERARIVELRFFGGLTIDEAAVVVGRSPRTVKRQWEVARGWLYREMSQHGGGDD